MLTDPSAAVDATPAAVMWSVSQIAERDKISKQAVSKKVKALAADHGLQVTRDGRKRITAINVAHYDLLRERTDDPSKAQRPPAASENAPATIPAGETYDDARRTKTWLEVERERISLGIQRGELVQRADVAQAVSDVSIEIVRIVERLPTQSDDLAAVLGRDGLHGLRVALKKLSDKMRIDIADALDALTKQQRAGEVPPSRKRDAV